MLTILLSLFILGAFAGVAKATEPGGELPKVVITRKGSIQATQGSDKTFTGDVDVAFLIPKRGDSRLSGGQVTFQSGARTHWHTHPYGQLLIVTDGKGRVQEWGEPLQEISPGDLVWFPAGVKHWHGAAPGNSMTHYALQEERDGQVVEWIEPVTDEQYNGKQGM